LSANLMSLAGLAIGIGMMVDGAVVMVENAFRIMAERREHGEKVDRTSAVLAAAKEVANPISFAILIIIVVFLPLFSLEGLGRQAVQADGLQHRVRDGRLADPQPDPDPGAGLDDPQAQGGARHLADGADQARATAAAGAALAQARRGCQPRLAMVASLALFPLLGKEFMPQLQEGSIMWRVTGIPSTSLDESIRTSKTIAEAFKKFPEVETTLAMIGRAEKGETADVNYMEIYTALIRRTTGTPAAVDQGARRGHAGDAGASGAQRGAGLHPADPDARGGTDLGRARHAGAQALRRGPGRARSPQRADQDGAAGVPGVADLSLEANVGKPQIRIEVDRDELARHGMNAEEVLTIVRNGLGGEPVSVLLDGVKRFDIAVRLEDDTAIRSRRCAAFRCAPPPARSCRWSEVADVNVAEGYSFVRREQLQRYAVIQMDVRGRDVDGFVQEASAQRSRQVELPPGYWIEWGGAFENQQRALAKLSLIVPITIFFIFVLLYTAFNSIKFAALILANVPFATIGGLLALFVTGQYLSVPSAIGFIAVFGVAMLNGIVLVSFLNEQREKGLSVREAVLQGTALRLRPVLMTASVAILGLVPMLLSSGVGAETQRPLATVVVGGLLSSTLLTLILLPVLYEWLENRAESPCSARTSRSMRSWRSFSGWCAPRTVRPAGSTSPRSNSRSRWEPHCRSAHALRVLRRVRGFLIAGGCT
jgi:cobalt-zinc-cadmium resistance protein CzcA